MNAENVDDAGSNDYGREAVGDGLVLPSWRNNNGDLRYCGTCGHVLGGKTETQRRRRLAIMALSGSLLVLTILGALVALRASGINGPDPSAPAEEMTASSPPPVSPDRLVAAFKVCDSDDVTDVISLADAGDTILISTGSEYGATQPVNCLFAVLGTSAAITSQINATSSIMGVQGAAEDGLSYSWSYHPDSGLNLVVTNADQ